MQIASEPSRRVVTLAIVSVFVGLVVDGMDMQMLSLALPLLMEDFRLTKVVAGSLATWTYVGMGVGGILGGWLADRVGRAKVTAWALAFFSVTTAMLAFTQSYWQFALIRFFSGFGLAAEYSIGNMLVAEYVSTRWRTTTGGLMQAGWSVGYVAAAMLASYILPKFGWRPLFFVAIIPVVLAVWMRRAIPEPPSWKNVRQKTAAEKRNEWADIWADKSIRRTFLYWSIVAIALQFGYYGANSWLPSYVAKDLGVNLKTMGWYVAGTYAAMIFGKLITGWLADIFGRRLMYTLSCIGTAAVLPLVVKFATPGNIALLLILFGLFYGAPYAVNATYMNESFPTAVRGTAMSTAYNVGRVGSIISPLFIGAVATQYSIGLGIALLGVAYAVCGIIPALFIREKMYDPRAS